MLFFLIWKLNKNKFKRMNKKSFDTLKANPIASIRFDNIDKLEKDVNMYNTSKKNEIYSIMICERKEWSKLLN